MRISTTTSGAPSGQATHARGSGSLMPGSRRRPALVRHRPETERSCRYVRVVPWNAYGGPSETARNGPDTTSPVDKRVLGRPRSFRCPRLDQASGLRSMPCIQVTAEPAWLHRHQEAGERFRDAVGFGNTSAMATLGSLPTRSRAPTARLADGAAATGATAARQGCCDLQSLPTATPRGLLRLAQRACFTRHLLALLVSAGDLLLDLVKARGRRRPPHISILWFCHQPHSCCSARIGHRRM